MVSPRVRVIRYVVSIDAVLDDGEALTPITVKPVTVSASEWDAFTADGLTKALADLQAQADAMTQAPAANDGAR